MLECFIYYLTCYLTTHFKLYKVNGSVPFGHSSIGHHQPQRLSRGFPLFKRCEWLVSNRFVFKRRPPKLTIIWHFVDVIS